MLSLWSLQASHCRSGTRQKRGVHRAAPSAHPQGMQRELGTGVTSPAMVLLGWSRGLGEDTGTEQLPGVGSSCVLGSATAPLAAPLLSVRVCPCQRSTRSDRDICESRAPLRRSAADERAGMRDSGAAARTVRTCGDGARAGTLGATSPVTSLKSLLN